MDRLETQKILSVIDVVYPQLNAAKDKKRAKKLVDIWCKMFIDNDYHIVGNALKAHISTSSFPPTVADIKEIIDNMSNPQITELEAWFIVNKASTRCGLKEQYKALPEEIKGFMSYWDFCDMAYDGTCDVRASDWQRSYKSYQERRKFDRIVGSSSGSSKLTQPQQDSVQNTAL